MVSVLSKSAPSATLPLQPLAPESRSICWSWLHLALSPATALVRHDDLVVGRLLRGDRADRLRERDRVPTGLAVPDVVREHLRVRGLHRRLVGDPQAGGVGAGTGRVGRLLVPEHLRLTGLAARVEVLGVPATVAAAVTGVDRIGGRGGLPALAVLGDRLLAVVAAPAADGPDRPADDEQRGHGGADDHGRAALEGTIGTTGRRRKGTRAAGAAGILRLARVAVPGPISGLLTVCGLLTVRAGLRVRAGLGVRPRLLRRLCVRARRLLWRLCVRAGLGVGPGLLRISVTGCRMDRRAEEACPGACWGVRRTLPAPVPPVEPVASTASVAGPAVLRSHPAAAHSAADSSARSP